MGRIAVVTDSSACLPPGPRRRSPIRTVPIKIHLPDRDLLDDVPGAASSVYKALMREEPVKSSAPTPVEYLAAIEEVEGDAAVVITPAAEFTAMHRNASLAAEVACKPVAVVDSRTAAAAHGLVVDAVLEAAARDDALDEVVAHAEAVSHRAELVATIDALDLIRRSGRVPSRALGLGQHLGVRPIFRLRAGQVERIGISRTTEGALSRIEREWKTDDGDGGSRCVVFHAEREELALELRRRTAAEALTPFSPAMGIHTGPGVVGIAWLRRPGPSG